MPQSMITMGRRRRLQIRGNGEVPWPASSAARRGDPCRDIRPDRPRGGPLSPGGTSRGAGFPLHRRRLRSTGRLRRVPPRRSGGRHGRRQRARARSWPGRSPRSVITGSRSSWPGSRSRWRPSLPRSAPPRTRSRSSRRRMCSAWTKEHWSIRRRPRSSIAVACQLVRRGQAAAVVSAGSTGGVVTTARLRLRPLAGGVRPALAAVLPTPAPADRAHRRGRDRGPQAGDAGRSSPSSAWPTRR